MTLQVAEGETTVYHVVLKAAGTGKDLDKRSSEDDKAPKCSCTVS